jgi:hypothetical protein
MLMPYILILFLASIATFYKLDKMLAGQKIWTRNFRIKLISSLQRWYFVDYLAFIIIFSILSLVVLVLIHESGSRPPKIIPQSIFLVICASTIIFATIHYNLREYYKKHSGTVKIVLTATTVVFTIMANSLTEDAIINYTHVDASHFPGAQKAFILIGTVLLWLYIGMYASLPAYFFVLAKLMKTFVHNERNKPSYVNSYTTPFNNIKRNFNLAFAAMLGATYTLMILLGAMDTLFSSMNTRLRETLVSASFHLPAEACGIYNRKFGTRVAPISEKQAVVATPDRELGYLFTTADCTMQPVVDDIRKIKPMHRFHYKDHELNSFNTIPPVSCPVQFCSILNGDLCI